MFPSDTSTGFRMRQPCRCGCQSGIIRTVNGQDTVRCSQCGTHQYNAPKTETGRAVRTVSTVHEAINPKKRYRIIERAHSCCELCGARDQPLHVGHLLSVKKGLSQGLTEAELNSDENLAAVCQECNAGQGDTPLPLWMCIAILKARMRNAGNDVIPQPC